MRKRKKTGIHLVVTGRRGQQTRRGDREGETERQTASTGPSSAGFSLHPLTSFTDRKRLLQRLSFQFPPPSFLSDEAAFCTLELSSFVRLQPGDLPCPFPPASGRRLVSFPF